MPDITVHGSSDSSVLPKKKPTGHSSDLPNDSDRPEVTALLGFNTVRLTGLIESRDAILFRFP